MFAVPVNVATAAALVDIPAEDRLAVAGAVVRSLPVADPVLVVLVSAVTDAGSSPVACEAELELDVIDDSLLDEAFAVCCSLVDTAAVVVGTKVGVLSVIDNGHILAVPVAEAIEIVASGI